MARGPKKHLKRIRAPKSWMMDKMGGVFVSRLDNFRPPDHAKDHTN